MTPVTAVAGLVALAVALDAVRRRQVPGGRAVAAAAASVAVWCLAYLAHRTGLAPRALTLGIWIPSVSVAATAFLVIARRAAAPGWDPTRRQLLAGAVEPVLVVVLIGGNPVHGILGPSGGPRGGLLFVVHTAYCIVLLAAGAYLLARRLEQADAARRPHLVAALGLVLVVVVVEIASLGAAQLVAAAGTVVLHRAVFGAGLNDLVPVTRGEVLDQIDQLLFSFDGRGRLVDVNRTAAELLRDVERREPRVGDPVARVLGPDVLLRDGARVVATFGVGPDRVVHTAGRTTALRTSGGMDGGWLVSLRRTGEEVAPPVGNGGHGADPPATRDPVAGCLDRAGLDRALATSVTAAVRAAAPLGLLVIDADGFKAVNDTHGHLGGDRALRVVADRITAAAGAGATTGRFGGDEFVVLLPGHDASRTATVAERVVAAVGASPVAVGAADVALTVSVGAAQLDDDATPTELLAAADAAMYVAKRRGGDDHAVAGSDPPGRADPPGA